MICSIRSTNGGGKSQIVRDLLSLSLPKKHYGLLGPARPEAYELTFKNVKRPIYVLGPYVTPTGGCDNIQPYDGILDLIRKYAPKGHVLFEGVIVSSSYGRVGRLMEEYGKEAVMAFLDTPLETCIENVKKRRAAKGDGRELDPKNLTFKYNGIAKSKIKIEAEGKVRVVTLNFGKAQEQVLALLRSAQ